MNFKSTTCRHPGGAPGSPQGQPLLCHCG